MRAAYATLEPTLPAPTTVSFEFSIADMSPVWQARRSARAGVFAGRKPGASRWRPHPVLIVFR
jgi:hypothetical protein